MKIKNLFIAVAVVGLALTIGLGSVGAATFYVATSGSASGPGTTWANAFNTIQAAVNAAASGDTVLVTNGVYEAGGAVASGPTNRVCITSAITVRSVKGPTNTFIVGAGPIGSSAVRCAYLSAGVLTGFTLTNGYTLQSYNWPYDCGGGAFLDSGGTVSNCVLTGCSAYDGGGGVICNSGGTLNNCTINGNTSNTGDGDAGGGVFCGSGGTLNNCVISGNKSKSGNGNGGAGGGVFCEYGGALNNCTIANNSASVDGGGVFFNTGGTLNSCLLYGNTANSGGGGVFIQVRGTLNNCTISTNAAGVGGNGV
jgi:hypothetical protein